MSDWPRDADGDVLRRLEADGCDFSKQHIIDFYIDFEDWPPSVDAVGILKADFASVDLLDKDEGQTPCVLCKIEAPITYAFVTETQARVSQQMKPFGGYCTDWGVMI